MDLVQLLLNLWHALANSLGSDAMAVFVTAAFVVALTAVWQVAQAFRQSEFYKQHEALWNLIDGRIADLIWLIEKGDVDLTQYEDRAKQREEEGLSYVDPRMLYLLDQAEAWVKEKFSVEVDFEELLARAEHIFDEVKNASGNSVGE